MSNVESRCLDAFPEWLRSLAEDALVLSTLVQDDAQPEARRRGAASALNYLFKSLDLIPDGIEDLGFLDDAFVLRVAAAEMGGEGSPEAVQRMSEESTLLREFLGADYPRLERFVSGLGSGPVRGRTADQIVADAAVRAAFVSDVKGWAGSYVVPAFGRDTKNLVKLRSFLGTKLPA